MPNIESIGPSLLSIICMGNIVRTVYVRLNILNLSIIDCVVLQKFFKAHIFTLKNIVNSFI